MTDLMQYIDINPIVAKAKEAKELNCPFIAIIGGKGTGKTYGCVDYVSRETNDNNDDSGGDTE